MYAWHQAVTKLKLSNFRGHWTVETRSKIQNVHDFFLNR
jgi:hypothetical protein